MIGSGGGFGVRSGSVGGTLGALGDTTGGAPLRISAAASLVPIPDLCVSPRAQPRSLMRLRDEGLINDRGWSSRGREMPGAPRFGLFDQAPDGR
ncbi:MAG TPA: hypothetical protein DEP35_05590 [Deltaproteobacteria bacterium]|nr:hypothetical protein [Deltaproteobacteria bacterium]